MSLWNLGKAMTGNATDNYNTETKSTGTISQNFTGKMSLKGYAVSNTSNNATNVNFIYNEFTGNELVGQGVWSLQDNPIVYVVKDRLMGEEEDVVFTVTKSDYLMGATDPAPNNLRLMTFFDPTSIKINLNTSVYKDIRNVEMSWTYGVYPNQPHGHTDVYRLDMLDFKTRDMLKEPELVDKKLHADKIYKSYSSDFANVTYLEYPVKDMTTTYLDKSTKAKFYNQKGSHYRYYAHAGNDRPETDDNFFLIDPVVFLPTECVKANKDDEYGTGKLHDFEAPDFVVGVVLTFDYTLDDGSEAKAVLSQRFLPQVKSITTAEMLKKKEQLSTYASGGVHQMVGNVTIRHKNANDLLKCFFSTAEYIGKNKD